ncbi:hypothetical protein [Euzebyella saccharophila]|uniref:Uncharacterized protein n=1 Tax=Euzebyella saccharophila TaxID=679664 RepID=A0ABV8JR29_9FLAO|nr:hypothetical protein [Euzebyella saccharophila]
MMSSINIPNNYPEGCSDDTIKEVVAKCQNKINKYDCASNVVLGTSYYAAVAEQGNTELDHRLTEKLILNLEQSSKRQRELTWAIITIGGLNLIAAFLKLIDVV